MREMLSAPTPPPFGSAASFPNQAQALVRGQSSDERKPIPPPVMPTKLIMPAPEEYDLLAKPPFQASTTSALNGAVSGGMDWGVMRQEMDRYRAVFFRLEKMANGSFRFVCALPYPEDAQRQRQFEATGNSESEAMTLVMQQVRGWYRP